MADPIIIAQSVPSQIPTISDDPAIQLAFNQLYAAISELQELIVEKDTRIRALEDAE